MLGRMVQTMRRNRPGSGRHQHVVGRRRDHVIAENLPDEARAPEADRRPQAGSAR